MDKAKLIDLQNGTVKPAIPWRPILREFKGCNDKLRFVPEIESGYSYRTNYCIAKSIVFQHGPKRKRVMILNTYPYSRTTCGHIEVMRKLLIQLGYTNIVELEAPTGIEYMSTTVTHVIHEYAKARVEAKFARAGCQTQARHLADVSKYMGMIDTLRSMGARIDKERLEQEEAHIAGVREKRLVRERLDRAKAKVEIFYTPPEMRDFNLPGIHLRTGEDMIVGRRYHQTDIMHLRSQAVEQGVKAVFIHHEPQRQVTAQLTDRHVRALNVLFCTSPGKSQLPLRMYDHDEYDRAPF